MATTSSSFQFGEWRVYPARNSLASGELCRQIEPRAMDVLLHLCQRHGQVLSAEQLLEACWGTNVYSDNPVHKVITQLRKALGDSSAAPRYIETIRKRGYRAVAEVAGEPEVAVSWLHESPFRGLQAFDERHAAIFFGRQRAATQLLRALQAQAAGGCAMLLVLGPSGSGKTSLIRAGVLPTLGLACQLHFDLAEAAGADLFQALGSVLLDAESGTLPPFARDSASTLGRRLRHEAPGVIEQLQALPGEQQLGLFVDRFEALFTQPHVDEPQRAAFIGVLELLARSGRVYLILACRNDFYPYVAYYAPLRELKLRGGQFDLGPPDAAELLQIVRQPAAAAQLAFETDPVSGIGLDQVLCDEARLRPDMLPLLQYCLQELYRQRGPGGTLSFTVFRALGGIDGAIGERAEQVARALSASQIAALPRVLSQLVSLSEETLPVTSHHLPWSALRDPASLELVQALVEARLFVSGLRGGVPTFSIAHDALLRRWPRVVDWIDSHRHTLQLHARIKAQAARWQASGRNRDFLLPRGIQANQARDLLQTADFQYGLLDREFILASLRRIKRGERRRAAMLILMGMLALLASALGLMARAAQQQAEQHRLEAESLMGYMLGEFVDRLRPLGRLDLLDNISGRALSYLTASRLRYDGGDGLTQRAKALQLIAEVKVARADPAGATQALLAARALLGAQAERAAADKALLKAAGANAYWLGQIELDQRNFPQAEAYFREYLRFSDRLAAADPQDVDGWVEQSYAHSNLGTVALKQNAVRRAADEFAASIALKTRALARWPAKQSLIVDLANGLSWLGSAREKLGQLDEAMALYQREAQLMQALHQAAPGNAQWTQRYAFSLWHKAELQQVRGEADAAGADFARAQTLLLAIVKQDPSNRSWQSALHTVQLRVLDTQAGPARDKLAALQVLQAKFAALSELEPRKWNLQRLGAVTAMRRARVHWELDQRDEALRQLGAATATLERLRLAAPGDQLQLESLADVLLLRAEFERDQRLGDAALATCRAVRRLLDPSARDSADFHLLAPWARAARCAGDVAAAAPAERQLSKMHYHEVQYSKTLSLPSTRSNSP